MKIVQLVNLLGRPLTVNLAPASDQTIHLPPHGRANITEDEATATEVVGGLTSIPVRLLIVDLASQTTAVSSDSSIQQPSNAKPSATK